MHSIELKLESSEILHWESRYLSVVRGNMHAALRVQFNQNEQALDEGQVTAFLSWLRMHPEITSLEIESDLGRLSHDAFEHFFYALPKTLKHLAMPLTEFDRQCCLTPLTDYLQTSRLKTYAISSSNFSDARVCYIVKALPETLQTLETSMSCLLNMVNDPEVLSKLHACETMSIDSTQACEELVILDEVPLHKILESWLNLKDRLAGDNLMFNIKDTSLITTKHGSRLSLRLSDPAALFKLLFAKPYECEVHLVIGGRAIHANAVLSAMLLKLILMRPKFVVSSLRYAGSSQQIVDAIAGGMTDLVHLNSLAIDAPSMRDTGVIAMELPQMMSTSNIKPLRLSLDVSAISARSLTHFFESLADNTNLKTLRLRDSTGRSALKHRIILAGLRHCFLRNTALTELILEDINFGETSLRRLLYGLVASTHLESLYLDQMQRFDSTDYFHDVLTLNYSLKSCNLARIQPGGAPYRTRRFDEILESYRTKFNVGGVSQITDYLGGGSSHQAVPSRIKIVFAYAMGELRRNDQFALERGANALRVLEAFLPHHPELREEVHRIWLHHTAKYKKRFIDMPGSQVDSRRMGFFNQPMTNNHPAFVDHLNTSDTLSAPTQ